MPFTHAKPLDYYYMHGYQIMNPFYRILSAHPQYMYLIDAAIAGGNDAAVKSVITKVLMDLKKATEFRGWDFMNLDETMMQAIFAGDASAEHGELVKQFGADAVIGSERVIMKGYRQQAADRLSDLVDLLEDARKELELQKRPRCSWVIRGDSSGMTKYLKTQGIEFPEVIASSAQCYFFNKDWQTNQFFSASDGDELASLAGRAIVWLIRIDPERTSGRAGGNYLVEKEVLFPYNIQLHLKGGIDVASENDIGNLNLEKFGHPEELRAKLLKVYRANRSAWTANKARFLIAGES
jgi:hypothetical protein